MSSVKVPTGRFNVPPDITLTHAEEGGFRVTPPRSGDLHLATICSCVAIGCACVPVLLALFIAGSSLSLASWIAVLAILSPLVWLIGDRWAGNREVWLLGENRFATSVERLAPTPLLQFEDAAFEVTCDPESRYWQLHVHETPRRQLLLRSLSINEVVGLATCLGEITRWKVNIPALPSELAIYLVTDAMRWNDAARLQTLLAYDFTLPALSKIWASTSRGFLIPLLDQVPELGCQLVRGLHSPDEEVRKSALELLGYQLDPETAPWVRGALEDTCLTIQRMALQLCADLKDVAAVPQLCEILSNGGELSLSAAKALGEIGDPGGVPALCEVLEEPHQPDIWKRRVAAAHALGQIQSHSATEALCVAAADRVPLVRHTAVKALGMLADHRAVEALGRALSDPELSVACEAAMSLSTLKVPRAVTLLCQAADAPEPDCRSAVLGALGKSEQVQALEPLTRALEDPCVQVRTAAAFGIYDLAAVAGESPLRFRAALSALDRIARSRVGGRDLYRACRLAIARIEEHTGELKDLPMPSEFSVVDPGALPLPTKEMIDSS